MVVIVMAPGIDQPPGVPERAEQRLVQQLVSEPGIFVSNASCLNFRLEQRELASARQTVSDIGQRSITPSEAVSYRRTL
jgi:hypothetical protein